jgi:phage gp29-like protein
MVFLPHISAFSYSVAQLCSAKKVKSETKIPIFRFNQKSLNDFNIFIDGIMYWSEFSLMMSD